MKNLTILIKKNSYTVLSFIVSALSMYLALGCGGVTIVENRTLINGDMLSIYLPAIKNLCRDIVRGESIYYAWNTCLGMNTSLYNAFYAFSPLNILYIVFGGVDVYKLTAWIIILKTGLAGLCFQIYISKTGKSTDIWSVVFSVCYSMCSFQMSYNTSNIIWLDAMFVLPMIFLHIDFLNKQGKYKGLVFWYSYIFISQFYMGYMIGVISFAYFVLTLAVDMNVSKIKDKILLATKYFFSVFWAVLISAFVWLPSLYFISENHVEDSTRHVSYGIRITDVLIRFFWGQYNSMTGPFPNVYCGIVIIILVPLFFIYRGISSRIKIVYGGLTIFVLISCSSNWLYMFWHGFDITDGWPFRFAYILSFLFCSMAAETGKSIKSFKLWIVCIIGILEYLCCFVGIRWQNERFFVRGIDISKKLIVNAILILIWCVILVANKYVREKYPILLSVIVIFVCMAETVSGYPALHISGLNSARAWYSSMETASEKINESSELVRVNSLYDLCVNSGTMFGFNGIGHFASAENESINRIMGKMGIYASPRIILNYGVTPVSEMLLGMRYTLYGIFEDIYNNEDLSVSITENNNALHLGYMVCGKAEDYCISERNAFEYNNELLSAMTGENVRIFERVNTDKIMGENRGIEIFPNDDGYVIEVDKTKTDKDPCYIYHVQESDKRVYSYILNSQSVRESGTDYFLLDGGAENAIQKEGDMKVSYIKELESTDGEKQLRISRIGNIQQSGFENIYFYEFNEDELEKTYDSLKEEQMIIEEYRDGYVCGKMTINDGRKLLFTTIPYDKGWSVRVNGIKQEIKPVLDDAFVAVELPGNGCYEIEFEFRAKGAMTGILISVLFSVFYLFNLISKASFRRLNNAN